MRLETTLPRRRMVSLTSLIDVVFLLLLFFMLATTFTRFAKVDIAGGVAGSSSGDKPPGVFLRVQSDGTWAINGTVFAEADQAAELERLKASGAEMAVLLVRDEMNADTLVRTVERFRTISDIPLAAVK